MTLFTGVSDDGANQAKTETNANRFRSRSRRTVSVDPLVLTIIIAVAGWTIVLASVLL